jgi:hypothetical protein
VAPTLAEWASRPLVGNFTLRGSGFSSLALGPLEGRPYLVMDRAIFMPVVATTVMRGGCAFSDATVARVVGDVGGRT